MAGVPWSYQHGMTYPRVIVERTDPSMLQAVWKHGRLEGVSDSEQLFSTMSMIVEVGVA